MTVSSTTNKARFNGAGSTGPFPFDFKTFVTTDLDVIQTDALGAEALLVLTTDYTVSLNADQNNDPGGEVTLVAPLPVGEVLTLLRSIDALQETDITNAGGFYPEVVEDALDRLTMLAQQNAEAIDRAVKVPVSSVADPDQLITDINQAVSDSAASAAAAAVSEVAAAASAADAADSISAIANVNGLVVCDGLGGFSAKEIGVDVQAYSANIATTVASQAEMEAGTEPALRSMSPQRVAQAISALSAADNVTLSLLMLEVADLQNQAQVMGPTGNRFADSFDALTYVDTGAATNLNTGTPGKLLPTSTQTKLTGGANIGDMTAGGGLAAAFDGTTSQARTSSASKVASASGYNNTVGKDWGSGVTKNIARIKVWGPNNEAFLAGGATSFKLQGSNDGSAWTDLYTQATTTATAESFDITSGITAGSYRYHRINVSGNGANSCGVAEVEFYEAAVANNMTVASTALTAASAPATMSALMRVDYVDTPTLNTDLMLDVSRDGGTTWTTSTLSLAYTAPGSVKVLTTNSISVSGQPSGTSPKWRIRTANNKMVHVRDVYLYWS